MRGPTKLVAVAAVLVLVASACAADDDRTASEICDEDEFGCVVYAPGEPIRLGTLLTLSGPAAFLGTDSLNGVRLAVDYLDGTLDGTPGQLFGRTIELVNEDETCNREGGESGGRRLAADRDTIVGVIGTTCSSSALGVADRILSEAGILTFSPSNTNPGLTAPGTHQPFYIRTAHNDLIQGAIVAEWAYNEVEARTAATINDESPYADALAAVFRENFEALGGSITRVEAIQSTDTDFGDLLARIGQDQPEFLFHPNFMPACGHIVNQAADVAGLANTAIVGADGCLEPSYLEATGARGNGTYASGPDLSGLPERSAFYGEQLLPAYREQFGTAPTAAFHAHAFDATTILLNAIQTVGIEDEDGTLSIPRTALRDAVFATSGHVGVTGTITCNETGDCADAVTIAIYEAPAWPVEGGTPDPEAVYSDTKSLLDLS